MRRLFGNGIVQTQDGVSRREFIYVGAFGISGLLLPTFVSSKALGATAIERDSLRIPINGFSAESVIKNILNLAEEKCKTAEVAGLLVEASLTLRLGRELPVCCAEEEVAYRDLNTRDFRIENTIVRVAADHPNEKHLIEIVDRLKNSDMEIWLLTRHHFAETWRKELDAIAGADMERVVVNAIESFVGQNISEMGSFSDKGKASQLERLFALYNERWVAVVGTPSIRIEILR